VVIHGQLSAHPANLCCCIRQFVAPFPSVVKPRLSLSTSYISVMLVGLLCYTTF
jgi:hypothetical protein